MSLELLDLPCIMFNSNGFFDSPPTLLNRMRNVEFLAA